MSFFNLNSKKVKFIDKKEGVELQVKINDPIMDSLPKSKKMAIGNTFGGLALILRKHLNKTQDDDNVIELLQSKLYEAAIELSKKVIH